MFFRLLKLPIAAWVLSLTACSLVPGSNISVRSDDRSYDWFNQANGRWFPGLRNENSLPATVAMNELVNIVAITPELLAEQENLTRGTQPNTVPASVSIQLEEELDSYVYRVANGDVLYVTVYDHPELTNPSGGNNSNQDSGNIVQHDGTIFYPYIGTVEVEGLTVQEIRQIISDRLAEFITAPQVDVRVNDFNAKRVYITGQVGSPGPQSINNIPLTVLDAIVNAGGLSDNANWHNVLLSRNGQEIYLSIHEMLNNGRLGENLLLQDGDVLNVPALGDQQVFVLGELGGVNTIPIGSLRISLTEALTRSGGLNQVTSDARGVFVIRREASTETKLATIYQLDVRNAIAFTVGTRFILQPMDIVYVTTAPVTRWNRVLSQILPSITTLFTIDAIGNL